MRRNAIALCLVSAALPALAALPAATATTQVAKAQPARHVRGNVQSLWSVNGTVYAIAQTAHRVYLGGAFSSVTRNSDGATARREHVVAFHRETGRLVRSWRPNVNGVVRALVPVPKGDRLFIGGGFSAVNSKPKSNLAALHLSRGTIDFGWHGSANGEVRALLLRKTRIYVGGLFTRVNGNRGHALAPLRRGNGTRVPNWDARVGGGSVQAIATVRGVRALIVGGTFSSLSGRPRPFLGSVGFPHGGATRWAPEAACGNCRVLDIDTYRNGQVFTGVAGRGGRVESYQYGRSAPLWVRQANGDVQAVDYRDNRVYVGGHFFKLAGLSRTELAEVRAGDGRLTGFRPNFDSPYRPGIWALRSDARKLRVGGGFHGVQKRANYRGYVQFPFR